MLGVLKYEQGFRGNVDAVAYPRWEWWSGTPIFQKDGPRDSHKNVITFVS